MTYVVINVCVVKLAMHESKIPLLDGTVKKKVISLNRRKHVVDTTLYIKSHTRTHLRHNHNANRTTIFIIVIMFITSNE